jgi:catechol 2,3-dioxygenase-like lactoylglutathione lyase family enzyme
VGEAIDKQHNKALQSNAYSPLVSRSTPAARDLNHCAAASSIALCNSKSMQIKRLDHIQICIPIGAEEKAREFYAGVLGLEEIEKPNSLKPNGGLWFKVADIQLHIGVEEEQSKSKRHPAFEVRDLEGIKLYLQSKSVKVKEETAIPGVNRFSFLDPFDNRIEFLEPA